MKIRSITCFDGRKDATTRARLNETGAMLRQLREAFSAGGYEVQTVRLALCGETFFKGGAYVGNLHGVVCDLERDATAAGIDYISLGPLGHWCGALNPKRIAKLIGDTSVVFTSTQILFPGDGWFVEDWFYSIGQTVCEISKVVPNGFGNLRFAALANCPPGIPFFPAAHAKKGDYSFALALECADLALDAVAAAGELKAKGQAIKLGWKGTIERQLRQRIEKHGAKLEKIAKSARGIKAKFTGCDWSLAPHPDESCSIGAALEKISGGTFGEFGTLTAVATLTQAIASAKVRKTGFCGVFMPMLEDAVLARRAGPRLDLQSLLLYSSVCGTGLDTIPLAGDVSPMAIASLLSDVATLAALKNKPLTARLMPVPGLKAGDKTNFDFPYLVNGRVFDLRADARTLIPLDGETELGDQP